jgi:hypothetical protein
MSSKSRLSVRIRGISHSTGIDVLKAVANDHSFVSKKTTSSSATTTSQPVVSLATDINGSKVGTISFPSEDIKDQALRHHAPDWKWDDDFSEMTLLRTPEAADLEYVKARSLYFYSFHRRISFWASYQVYRDSANSLETVSALFMDLTAMPLTRSQTVLKCGCVTCCLRLEVLRMQES